MKGTFTQSLFFTLLRTRLVLLSGLLFWLATAAISDVHIQPITFTIILLVLGSVFFLHYPVLRRFLRRLQSGDNADTPVYKVSLPIATLLLGVILSCGTIQAQVAGTVFRDFNGNGTRGTASPNLEPGIAEVIVNAYNASNTIIASYKSGLTGIYSIPASGGAYNNTEGSNTGFVPAGTAVRIEFVIPVATANVCGLSNTMEYSSLSGSNYGSSVQFVSGGATDINFAINNPVDWVSTTNPQFITSRYLMGPIGASGRVTSSDGSIVGINNNDFIPIPASIPGSPPNGNPTIFATQGQVASVYGIAHHKKANVIFSSAFVRRHMPLIEDISGNTPVNGSTGRIFTTNLNNALPNGTTFIDVNSIGVTTGTITRSDMTVEFDWFCDADAAVKVGKVGLGDIDIADDGSKLFFVNLFNRSVYGINLSTALTTPVAGDVTNYAANAPWLTNASYQCTGGVARPFALKYYRGKVYVGVVCTAENGGTRNDLYARVFELDPVSGVWTATPIVEQQLNYTKDGAQDNATSMDAESFQWNPWPPYINTSFNPDATSGNNTFPNPMITDIEFDVDGSIILGLGDRNGYCTSGGTLNVTSASPTGGKAIGVNCIGGSDQGFGGPYPAGVSGGDILRFGRNPTAACAYTVENDGQSYVNGVLVTASPGATHKGLGGGEFYHDGFDTNSNHAEIYVGGIAIFPGLDRLIGGVIDPLRLTSGGLMSWNSQTGDRAGAFELFFGNVIPSPSKSAGLGDVEFLGTALTNLEIGNRIWMDTDDDGIQDAGEMGIGSIPVQLFQGATQVGATTTAADGTFYFNNSNVNLNGATGLLPNTAYVIRVAAADFPSGKSLSTNVNIGGAGQPDVRDNDATLNSGNAEIAVTTGNSGENNHTLDMAFRLPVCSITLTPTVSGCYQNSGSKSTVSVEVAWANATVSPIANNTSDLITVTFAGQTKTINPGPFVTPAVNTSTSIVDPTRDTIVSPQVVSFEVTADGSAQTIQAFFGATYTASTCKREQTGVVLPAACPPIVCVAGQTGGTVWNDFSADGTKQAGESTGVLGVTVTAYDCAGNLVGTATTDGFGKYVFSPTIAASAYPIRVEFSNLPVFAGNGTPNGSDGRTTVQFVNAADCNVDLGILDPTDYCQTNPKLVIPRYVNGNPLVPGTSASSEAVVSFDYNASGLKNTAIMSQAAASQVGTVWGMAYNKFTKRVFSSATVKRHAGLGPLGLGGIYVADFTTIPANGSTFNYSNFIDISTIGINVGTIANNTTRGLSADNIGLSVDNDGYLKSAKVGIGGIDLSADGNKLYLTNLFDNKLYEIDITAYNADGTTKPTAANVRSFDMGAGINCVGGNLHIWAVKAYKGKVYTGMVCDASISQNKSDLRAYIRELNGTTVSTIFDFPLTYPKGFVSNGSPNITGWYPWTDNWDAKKVALSNPMNFRIIHPEPILTSLEFDVDGSMVLAFADRTGLQSGFENFNPNGDDGKLYEGNAGGDILRAYSNGTSFVLENNAKAGNASGYGPGNNQGPGFGEFYQDDFVQEIKLTHAENVVGGLALIPGSGEVLVTVMDPINIPIGVTGSNGRPYFNSGGVRHLSNTSGKLNLAFQIYGNSRDDLGTFGKSVGLGDAVLLCDVPTFLQIGNYAWIDADQDGTQDPCEATLPGVKVSLYNKTTNTFLAVATTNANGEYYFTGTGAAGETWATATGVNSTLQPSTQYTVVFGYDGSAMTSQYSTGTSRLTVSGTTYTLTTVDSGEGSNPDFNDSDATAMAVTGQPYTNYPMIMLTTGTLGSVNHTYDAGFVCATIATFTPTAPTCTGTMANNNGIITFATATDVTNFGISTAGAATYDGPAYPATAFTAIGQNVSITIPNTGGTYIVRVFNGAAGCFADVPVTVAAVTCVTPCALTAATKTLETCNNNGTTGTGADDYISFRLNPTGTGLGASYSVTASGGATVTRAAGGAATGIAYGTATAFRLQNGSSNGTLYTITVTDVSGSACTVTTTVQQSATCSAPPPCALTAITFANPSTCNDNGTNAIATDDYFTADITVTFSNPPATDNLVLTGDVLAGGGATSVTVATAGAGPTYTFTGVRLRADGTASAVTATFSADNACTFSVINGPNVPSCSNCIVPVLATTNGTVCIGNTVSLATLVTGNSPVGTLTFYTSQSDATAGTNALVNSTVAPIANTTYYVRSETIANCFSTALVSVTVAANPAPTVTNGTVCSGGSINLATLVTSTGGGTLSFYTTQADANAGTNALASSTVSPTTATNYYVRSTAAGCFGVKEITITISPVVCGTPSVTGPN